MINGRCLCPRIFYLKEWHLCIYNLLANAESPKDENICFLCCARLWYSSSSYLFTKEGENACPSQVNTESQLNVTKVEIRNRFSEYINPFMDSSEVVDRQQLLI